MVLKFYFPIIQVNIKVIRKNEYYLDDSGQIDTLQFVNKLLIARSKVHTL